MQRLDLMAIPAASIAERRTGAGIPIAGVRLVDGSTNPKGSAEELAIAALPLTLFFKIRAEYDVFKQHVGGTPPLFMCLSGNCGKDGKVQVPACRICRGGRKALASPMTPWLKGARALRR